MRKIIYLIGLILLLGVFLAFSQAPSKTTENDFESKSHSNSEKSNFGVETYIQRQIIFAHWGSTENEMGLRNIYSLGDFKFASGPSGIKIDQEGNIYIWDGVNEKIQKYDKNGKYLRKIVYSDFALKSNLLGVDDFQIDNNSDIYFLMHTLENGSVIKDYFVRRYTPKRGVIDFPIYIRQEVLDLVEKRIYIENGDVFIASSASLEGWQILNKGAIVSLSLQKIRKQMPCQEGRYESSRKIESEETGIAFAFDRYCNIYLIRDLSAISALGPQDWDQKIYKYDIKGDLLAEVKLELDHLWYRRDNISIDEYGNIYQLLSRPEGAYVMKWEVTKK